MASLIIFFLCLSRDTEHLESFLIVVVMTYVSYKIRNACITNTTLVNSQYNYITVVFRLIIIFVLH